MTGAKLGGSVTANQDSKYRANTNKRNFPTLNGSIVLYGKLGSSTKMDEDQRVITGVGRTERLPMAVASGWSTV